MRRAFRHTRSALLLSGLLGLVANASAQQAPRPPAPDITPVHDPVIIRDGDRWHIFSTGFGEGPHGLIAARSSHDMVDWQKGKAPFDRIPAWAVKAIPAVRNLWAPDVSFVDGRYRLYYSVSTFGSNRSAIGLATSASLDPAAPGYGWRDEGSVVESRPGDDFNAIDPAFLADANGGHWLALGSFWSGLKLFRLDPRTGKLLDPAAKPLALASRPAPAGAPAAIEAPFLLARDGWYWLIASYDYCCKGAASTYYTVIGRSRSVQGPYRGKDGSSMLEGGGTILLHADLPEQHRFRGPGHAGQFRDGDGTDWLVYHAYDREARGAATLRIARLRWGADGWPIAETR